MAERRERMALLSRYAKLHTLKYGEKPTHNLNAEQWAADNIIESYGLPTCYDLLAYYFDNAETPAWQDFVYSAGRVYDSKSRYEKDLKERAERRKKAKEWLNG